MLILPLVLAPPAIIKLLEQQQQQQHFIANIITIIILIYWDGLARAKAEARARARRRAIVKKRRRTGHLSRPRRKAHVCLVPYMRIYYIEGLEDIGEMFCFVFRAVVARFSGRFGLFTTKTNFSYFFRP